MGPPSAFSNPNPFHSPYISPRKVLSTPALEKWQVLHVDVKISLCRHGAGSGGTNPWQPCEDLGSALISNESMACDGWSLSPLELYQ